jgi:hypothetical protein
MTGYQSKKSAALDEEGMYLVHHTQPAQEPVAFFNPHDNKFYWAKPTKITAPITVYVEPMPLYTAPPQRPWVGLTQEEVEQFHNWKDCTWSTNELVQYVEATLRSKNT